MLPALTMKRSNFSIEQGFSPDQYETPGYVFDMILEELDPRQWTIWEPFPGSGHSTRYISSRGFSVTNGDHSDFFEHSTIPTPCKAEQKVVVVSNPPYSKKKEIMQKLKDLGVIHIALFVPVAVMARRYFAEAFPQMRNQIIFHQRACSFLHPVSHKSMGKASFPVMWVTCGLNMSRDIMHKGLN